MALCTNDGCTNPIPPGNRAYCSTCSPRASAIWKRRNRPLWLAEWRAGGTTADPRLDGWPSAEAKRAYFREYMRAWRLKARAAEAAAKPETLVPDTQSIGTDSPAVSFAARGPEMERRHGIQSSTVGPLLQQAPPSSAGTKREQWGFVTHRTAPIARNREEQRR